MTPFEEGYNRTMKTAGIKEAVRLPQLRKATKALKERVPVIRRNLQPDNPFFPTKLTPGKVVEGVPESQGMGPMTVRNLPPEHRKSFLRQKLAPQIPDDWSDDQIDSVLNMQARASKAQEAPLRASEHATIYQGGSPARLFADHYPGTAGTEAMQRMRQSGPGQEAFNRWVLLHEGSEAGKHFGDRAFASHLSTRPMLRDLNVASTLEGPGEEAADAIRQLRGPEIEILEKLVPDLKRLDLGEQRLSRHAQRRIQEAYERALEERGIQGIPGMNA